MPVPNAVSEMLRLKRSSAVVSCSADTPVCSAANCNDCNSFTVKPSRRDVLARSSICSANFAMPAPATKAVIADCTEKIEFLTRVKPLFTDANALLVRSIAVS